MISGELNPLSISFFLLLLGADFEIFAAAIIHRGTGCLFLKMIFPRRRSASSLPSWVTERSLPVLSCASKGLPSNHIIRITRFVYIACFLFFLFLFSFKA